MGYNKHLVIRKLWLLWLSLSVSSPIFQPLSAWFIKKKTPRGSKIQKGRAWEIRKKRTEVCGKILQA